MIDENKLKSDSTDKMPTALARPKSSKGHRSGSEGGNAGSSVQGRKLI